MPKLTFLPHSKICPQGKVIVAPAGTTICNAALAAGLAIEHACEKACACTTCHVIVRQGLESLESATEKEEDMLDKAWG
ncbi:MAG: 2Fe-2S iron-sulfur cluster binding domain-containing protein, partial [Gammaproteobacteria bacterium]|nr:2Fe-2S iron-sulfur cluster binding domain-containing protein [Gammaproteobacteria bacterium]